MACLDFPSAAVKRPNNRELIEELRQKNEILRGPEDRDGLSTWLTDANDDAGNARPAQKRRGSPS